MSGFVYSIYSHSDADGGIAAAMMTKHILRTYPSYQVEIEPVNHGLDHPDWTLRKIQWPCAILDFTLHPSLLSEKFFQHQNAAGGEHPSCYWLDHHPTGSPFSFLKQNNLSDFLSKVLSVWDTDAISTPGLIRKHAAVLGFSQELVEEFAELIDLAEVIDGALFASAASAHDFESPAVVLQTLFQPSHPVINRKSLYRKIVRFMVDKPHFELLYDSDPIYQAIIDFESAQFLKQLRAYEQVTRLVNKVSISDFKNFDEFKGIGRFVPYLLFSSSFYAVHISPEKNGYRTISCGINPWNKPTKADKHLGSYFAKEFEGGGHSFVAGGKIHADQFSAVERLLDFLNS